MFDLKSEYFPAVFVVFSDWSKTSCPGQPNGWVETNPLVFWYQLDHLRSPAKNLSFFAGYPLVNKHNELENHRGIAG